MVRVVDEGTASAPCEGSIRSAVAAAEYAPVSTACAAALGLHTCLTVCIGECHSAVCEVVSNSPEGKGHMQLLQALGRHRQVVSQGLSG